MTRITLIRAASLALAAALTCFSTFAQESGDCAISYTRAACPGKEAISFAKCDGKASCTKQVQTGSPQACQAAALKACANDRLDITKSKVIGASYKGELLKSTTGKDDFCADYDKRAVEFDKCGN